MSYSLCFEMAFAGTKSVALFLCVYVYRIGWDTRGAFTLSIATH